MIKAFFKSLFTRGHWKHPGRTYDIKGAKPRMFRILLGIQQVIGGLTQIFTLGEFSYWGDISFGMGAYEFLKKKPPEPPTEGD